ncbi:hypothetical protein PVK06_015873 [Gossypium arboreum]|uniref:Uncharacterized protein n=1 Tax=Gossypium arboreum TaxID=29729 RepID=A0ABR0PZD9_GOSAR|nr:hypothetical protein PVK06_015873 [Gossypium arboreum]
MWNNRFGRIPPIDRCLDLRPSTQYLQWYYENGKPFLFGGRSMVVPPHTTRIGQYFLDPHHAPTPEPEPEPEPEAVPDLERRPEPELHSGTSSYHPDLGADDYFSGFSAQAFYSDFDIFSPLPHLYSTPPSSYPPPFSTPLGSSSSVAFETFSTPLHMDEENVDRRSRPQRERRAPKRYTPRTTP